MFNRNNLPSVPNPFGSRPDGGRPPPQGYANPNQAPPRYDHSRAHLAGAANADPTRDNDVTMTDASADTRGYGGPPLPGRPQQQQMPPRMPVGGRPPPGGGQTWTLQPDKSPDTNYTFGNLYVCSHVTQEILGTDSEQRRRFTTGYSAYARPQRHPRPDQ
jgi:vesicle-fusing ATPase